MTVGQAERNFLISDIPHSKILPSVMYHTTSAEMDVSSGSVQDLNLMH